MSPKKLQRRTLGSALLQVRNRQTRIEALTAQLEQAAIDKAALVRELNETKAAASAAKAAAERPEL